MDEVEWQINFFAINEGRRIKAESHYGKPVAR
jgi:hypothetical protein